jgi:hypothetical protein
MQRFALRLVIDSLQLLNKLPRRNHFVRYVTVSAKRLIFWSDTFDEQSQIFASRNDSHNTFVFLFSTIWDIIQ